MDKLEHAAVRVSVKDVKSRKSLASRMFVEKLVPAQLSAPLVVSMFFQRWAIFSTLAQREDHFYLWTYSEDPTFGVYGNR
jgi:hypothetical protein